MVAAVRRAVVGAGLPDLGQRRHDARDAQDVARLAQSQQERHARTAPHRPLRRSLRGNDLDGPAGFAAVSGAGRVGSGDPAAAPALAGPVEQRQSGPLLAAAGAAARDRQLQLFHVVWLGTDKHLQANTTQRFETASTELALPAELSGRPSYAAVTVQDWHGYRSTASVTFDPLFLLAPTGGSSGGGGGGSGGGGGGGGSDAAVAGESPHVYVAVAVAVAVVVVAALAAALAVLLVRQRRLQRSFVNFVNPHYDTRSGAATFTDQTLGKTNKYKQKNAVFTFF